MGYTAHPLGRTENAMTEKKSLKLKLGEMAAWLFLVAIFWTMNTQTMIADKIRDGIPYDLKALYMIEGSSGIAALIMINFVVVWSERFPFHPERVVEYIIRHLLGSVIFSLGHVGLMALFREMLFDNYIGNFVTDNIFSTLLYEYRKDAGLYLTLLIIVTVYRLYREKKQLEAHSKTKNSERMLVKTRSGEKLIEKSSIEWLKAAANYVELHADGTEYLVRTTMTDMERRLTSSNFARVHKSFIVNLDKINEITPTESGDFRISMISKAIIPLSRRYRESLEGIINL